MTEAEYSPGMDPHAHLEQLAPGASSHPLLDRVHAARDAADQPEYEARAHAVFATLDSLDKRLGGQRYLASPGPGPEDWALYVVLLRFELVYYALYKLNRTRLREFPNLGQYLLDLHQQAPETDLDALVAAAWTTDMLRNPKGTVPLGRPDLDADHDRRRFDHAEQVAAGTEEAPGSRRAGEFVRDVSAHRRWIGRDVPPASGRYHLIVSDNCPWCHRVAVTRGLKGLEAEISMDTLYYRRDAERGWQFRPEHAVRRDLREGALRTRGLHRVQRAHPVGQTRRDGREQRVRRDHSHAG